MRASDAFDAPLDPDDLDPVALAHLRRAVELARSAREHGNHPFGALLVTADGRVIEAENTVITGHDPIGHAETNLVRDAGQRLEMSELAGSTLYTSTEPCAMCSGAIYWAGIPEVVFALSEAALRELVDEQEGVPTLSLPSREVFARGGRTVNLTGPVALPAATAVHEGFWE
ncbi:nucleoside deaminase [Herbiconiux sp. A18JL235]|uniref:Nucleoside deaminase n=1 Tax=Herbiconiux sp. A18JL235 TaxID=3152363 RepID=A0AB39BF34_9MICO